MLGSRPAHPSRQAAPSAPAPPPLLVALNARPLEAPSPLPPRRKRGRCVPDAGPGGCRAPAARSSPLACAPPPPPPLCRALARPRPAAGSRPGPATPRVPGLRGGGGRRVKPGSGKDAGLEPGLPPPGQGERALPGGWRGLGRAWPRCRPAAASRLGGRCLAVVASVSAELGALL